MYFFPKKKARNLESVSLPLRSIDDCSLQFGNVVGSPEQLCLGVTPGKAICHGDRFVLIRHLP